MDKIISVANMYFKPDARISDEEYLRTYNVFRLGDIAFEGNKSKNFAFGRFVENTIGDGIVSHVFVVFRPLQPDHNLGYWKYAINNENVMGRILARCTKKTTMMTNLVSDDFLEEEMFCPSNAEQRKISSFLELLERKIDAQIKLVEHLKKYKRGLLSSLLDKEEWQTVLMQDVASGFDYGMNSAATEYDGKHKYIRITDIDESTHKYISTECVSPSDLPETKYKVEENDILFARTGASVGKSYIYDSRDGELYYAGFLIRASVKPDFNSYFVYLNTLTLGYQRWVVLESTRSGQPGINAEQYRNYKFKCPPIEIQSKIANIFIRFDLKLQREQEILDCLLNYKKAMMQNIFV